MENTKICLCFISKVVRSAPLLSNPWRITISFVSSAICTLLDVVIITLDPNKSVDVRTRARKLNVLTSTVLYSLKFLNSQNMLDIRNLVKYDVMETSVIRQVLEKKKSGS